MFIDVIVYKSDMSVDEGGGGKEKKVFINEALENKLGPLSDKEEMDTLSMVVLTIGRTCFKVVSPLGS